MKSKHTTSANGCSKSASELPDALAAHGEHFMSMFDDYDEQEAKRHKAVDSTNSDNEPSSLHASNSESTEALEDGDVDDHRRETHPPAGTSKSAAAAASPRSNFETFLSGKSRGAGLRTSASVAPSKAQLLEQLQQQEQQRLLERRLKKQFLSAKVSKIFSDVDISQPVHGLSHEAEELTPEQFAQMKREVEMLGGSALDKRSAKAWRASMLAKLGASADKAPRTPAKIGLGMAKKAKQREAIALQEAIAAGMIKAKGRGKKIRAEKAKQRDKGLMEAGPGFKNGVLRLNKKYNRRS